ncbi:MAG: glycine zipper family protein [Wolbachia endosymbiont of Homalodisca vitripennis]|nr:glycine zipper family protein [Wolbachia endosymbiont of Homalodisca vitripennis]MCJ7454953.1 glycine zipper family protein [Wolbachia endosymbiont of Homalodisca vitripennis]MCJ7475954.1 glycine zipper family protein [Wolbachia endosymbiont of Homalodisca vitripennis]
MVQSGTANPTNSDKFIEDLVRHISKKEDLLQKLQDLLRLHGFEKKGEIFNESTINDMYKFLMENKDLFGGVISLILEDFEKNKVESKEFLEQVNKVKGMEKELETLGNGLLAQGLISGAAVTTLTGALAGLLTVGGVIGALIVGGAAFIGFVALVAIAAISYAIYQHRGEIQQGVIDIGKKVKSSCKDLLDLFPTIKARENNFDRLRSELLTGIADDSKLKEGQSVENAKNQNKIVEMLQNQKQKSAIQKLVEDGDIKEFSEKDMERLLQKGLSTHREDMEKPQDKKEPEKKDFSTLMDEFQSAIMKFGNDDIEKVIEKVNEKAQEMKPSSKMKESKFEQVNENNITR